MWRPGCPCCTGSSNSNSFSNQYMQQHAQMTRWIQQLHGNLPSNNPRNVCRCCQQTRAPQRMPVAVEFVYNNPPNVDCPFCQEPNRPPQPVPIAIEFACNNPRNDNYPCCQEQTRPPQAVPVAAEYAYNNPPNVNCPCCQELTRPPKHMPIDGEYVFTSAPPKQPILPAVVEDNNEYDDYEEDDGGELVLNIDAILAMRAKRAEKEPEEESFELIDSTEEFEIVKMNSLGKLDKKQGMKVEPDTLEDNLAESETKKYLYGEKADLITGLETSVAVNFERLCDIHQPHVWPVLPVRMNF